MTARQLTQLQQDTLVEALSSPTHSLSGLLSTLRSLAKRDLAYQGSSSVMSFKLTEVGIAEAQRIIAERETAAQERRRMLDTVMGRFEATMDALCAAQDEETTERLVRSAAAQLAEIDTLGEDDWTPRWLRTHLQQAANASTTERVLNRAASAVKDWRNEPQARWTTPETAEENVETDPAAQADLEARQARAEERRAQEERDAQYARQKVEERREERLAAEKAMAECAAAVLTAAGIKPVRRDETGTVAAPGYVMRTGYGSVSLTAEVCPPTIEQRRALESAPTIQEWSAHSEKIHTEWSEQRAVILGACQAALEADGWATQLHGKDVAARLRATPDTTTKE